MYIFAGYDGLYKNDLYKFSLDESAWSSIRDSNPSAENWPKPRYRTSLIVHKDTVYMFGGHDGTKQLNDFYSFDPMLEAWSQININDYFPSPRDSHVAISYSNSLFLFGGSTGAAVTSSQNDLYEFNFDEKKWYQMECSGNIAPSRFCHVGVLYSSNFYIFGGYDGVNRLNDFYYHSFEPENKYPESTILNDLTNIVNNPTFSDVRFRLHGDRIVYAHKILLIRIPYFSAMFEGQMMESKQDEVKIENISYNTFLQLLNYVYTDKVKSDSIENIVELFEAADLYGIDRLKMICEKEIYDMIDMENAPNVLRSVDKREALKLRDYALDFIVKNFDVVSKTKAFENMMRSNIELTLEIIRKR